jgi:hypothetical protein
MRTFSHSILVLIFAAALCGCVTQEENTEIPPPTITKAAFVMGYSNTVTIRGEFFKIKSDNMKDVLVNIGGNKWEPAKAITDSSPTSYTADLPYGINFPEVWVRVFGLNGEYSGPFLVQGQQ